MSTEGICPWQIPCTWLIKWFSTVDIYIINKYIILRIKEISLKMVLHADYDWSKMDLWLGFQVHKDSTSKNLIIYLVNLIDICLWSTLTKHFAVCYKGIPPYPFLLYYMFLGGEGWLFCLISAERGWVEKDREFKVGMRRKCQMKTFIVSIRNMKINYCIYWIFNSC